MKLRAFALAATLCLLARAAWPASEIIGNFVDMPVRTANGVVPTQAEVRDAIVNAGPSVPARPWTMTDSGPGKLLAQLQIGRKRTHVVVVEVAYSSEKYSIQYRNSVHMNYRDSDKTIHTSYNAWVKELATQIDQELAALRPVAAPTAALSAAPVKAPASHATPGMPQVGDSWTYKATLIRRRGDGPVDRPVRTQVITVSAASESEIVEQLTIDGAAAGTSTHTKGTYLAMEGVSIFSPHIGLFQDVSQTGSLGGVDIRDRGCDVTYSCDASARIMGTENVRVAAGTFSTTKIVVKHDWAPRAGHLGGGGMGGRTVTLWYAPDVKRVVKYSSRATVGAYAPIDPHFDLELVSYQLK